MNQGHQQMFPQEVIEHLKTYVYRLIDPRNGETFYIGKGTGNRVFVHCAAEASAEMDELEGKFKRIREIRNKGFDVAHVIHRHGMDVITAFEVEAALLDAYPGLTNQVGGHNNGERGVMHSREIMDQYSAEEIQFLHKVLLISINQSIETLSIYDATRYAWKIDPKKADRAEVILATQRGLVRGVFIADRWLKATPENFPGFPEANLRWGFEGKPASDETSILYMRKRVPDAMRKKGSSNPIRYSF